MTPNIFILALGGVLLLVGIVGGGFEMKEFKIPKVGPVPRILATIAGLSFVVLGIALGNTEARANPDMQVTAKDAENHQQQAQSVEFAIYDQLGEGQVTEQVTVLIDGKVKGQLTVDRHNPQSMLTVTVPTSGRYSYTVESRTVVKTEGGLYEYPGTGQGIIDVQPGKRFDVLDSVGGSTWVVTLMDGARYGMNQSN